MGTPRVASDAAKGRRWEKYPLVIFSVDTPCSNSLELAPGVADGRAKTVPSKIRDAFMPPRNTG
jgi:hypothetical protein